MRVVVEPPDNTVAIVVDCPVDDKDIIVFSGKTDSMGSIQHIDRAGEKGKMVIITWKQGWKYLSARGETRQWMIVWFFLESFPDDFSSSAKSLTVFSRYPLCAFLLAVSLEILDDMDASNKPPAAPPLPLPPSTAGLVRSSDGRGSNPQLAVEYWFWGALLAVLATAFGNASICQSQRILHIICVSISICIDSGILIGVVIVTAVWAGDVGHFGVGGECTSGTCEAAKWAQYLVTPLLGLPLQMVEWGWGRPNFRVLEGSMPGKPACFPKCCAASLMLVATLAALTEILAILTAKYLQRQPIPTSLAIMCTYQSMEYSCGHRRTIVAEWCDRYKNTLQLHIRCPPEIRYYTTIDRICPQCHEQLNPRVVPWMPSHEARGSQTRPPRHQLSGQEQNKIWLS
uniref:Uncharacterized protein n=1 Tax=Pyricularia oryzae (strain P131) TaxID=1143193 RepID=L7JRU4_PYRO1